MDILALCAGIDVSLDALVVSVGGAKAFEVPNTQEGALELARLLPKGCTVHMESSGAYHRLAERVLAGQGFKVRVHNAYRLRRLSDGLASKAKTDPLDAKALSLHAGLLPSYEPKTPERQDLADLGRAIDSVKETMASFKKKLAAPNLDEDAKQAYRELVGVLAGQAKRLEAKFAKRVMASSSKEDYMLARSVRCIGPVAARVCICELPQNVRSATPAQASSYSGLAPMDDSSGKRHGAKHVGRGNVRLKRTLYMCALTAIATQPWARDHYARLRAKGKTHQEAIVPIMRKLLLRVVCVLKRRSPWQDEPPGA